MTTDAGVSAPAEAPPSPSPSSSGSPRRGRGPSAAAGVVLVGLVVLSAIGLRIAGDDAVAAALPPPTPHVGRFVVECAYSHSGPNDPIVHPGHTGMSHLHDFFGNVSTDATSTAESLAAADTTCFIAQDKASYWAPALYDGEERIVPTSSDAYYRAAPGVDPTAVEPFPFGLKVIAGDATSAETPPLHVVGWACGRNRNFSTEVPTCTPQKPLTMHVFFPDCWDGASLDSADHKQHLAYSTAGTCGRSHPVHVPQLEFAVQWPFWGDPAQLRLASGPLTTAHADFFNAWDPERLAVEVEHCIGLDAVCGVPSF